MKINNTTPSLGLAGAAIQARSQQTAQPTASAQAQVSASIQNTQEIQTAVANSPVVNTERVKEIKQAIAEGRFQINPEKIADGLIDNVRLMLRSNTQSRSQA